MKLIQLKSRFNYIKNLLLVLIATVLIGCQSPREIIREVPVEVTHTEYQNVYHHDSIYVHDSIYMWMKEDTVFKEVYKNKYVTREVHDTLLIQDTIPITVTITESKIVEKKVPQWWPVYLTGGLLLILAVGYLIYKFKNKISWLKF